LNHMVRLLGRILISGTLVHGPNDLFYRFEVSRPGAYSLSVCSARTAPPASVTLT
jgi:hypothetical protein